MRVMHEALEATARRLPEKTMLVCGPRRLSFGEVDAAANRLANGLISIGIRPGDRIAVYVENSPEAVISIFGILKAGAVFSVVTPTTKASKLADVLADEQAGALITINDPRRLASVSGALSAAFVPIVIWVGGCPEQPAPGAGGSFLDWAAVAETGSARSPEVGTIDLDLGTIIYTSGTTGRPKGVMSAHRDMLFAATAINDYLGNTADDVLFCSLPLAHTYGLYQLFTATLIGATVVLEPGFIFPAQALATMDRERVTGLPGVPTMFAVLLRQGGLDGFDLTSLRYLTNAAAPLPPDLLAALRRAFPQVQLFSMYGQTECKRACYLPPEELDSRPDSVGIPLPGTEAYVVDDSGRRVPAGVTGELVLRGSHLMRGYWGKPEETAARLRPGPTPGELALHTGDLFRADEDGFLYFVGRSDDIIKSRGEKVSPHEIETALRRLPGVADVAAFGVPDDVLGEAIKVVVVPEPGSSPSEREVRAFCARELDDNMVPKHVEFRDELPRTDHGKLERKKLATCAA
jgi:long-chain acyl-CoA synthetase